MKIKDIIDFCKTLDVIDDPQEKIKEYHDQSFNYKAPSDNTTASGFTDKVRTSILTQFSNLSFGTFDTDGTYSDSISASLLIDKAKTSGSSNAEAHFKQAGLNQDEKALAQGMNQYLKNILESINEVSIYLITKDTSLANNPDRFIKYLFICEHYDAIISECGHDEQVIKQLDALREHPTIKFIEARMNIIANPLYAKYYNDGAIYNASDDYFEASKNDPEEEKYLPELLENLKTVRDLADQKRAEAERTEPSFKALRLLEETLEADGYTKYQTNHMTFYDINGKKIGGFYRLASRLLSEKTMPYFFAALPGGPLRKYDNNISHTLSPDSAQRYGSIKPVSGDPYENLFRSGTAKLSASAKAAHISSGSSQYAEMEKLFNEYNALISKKGFDQLRAAELIEKLSQAADTYLAFKESQRGNYKGMIRGKNSREQRRIDFASSVREFAAGKLEYTNNIRTNILLNTQYITLENPTATFSQNGINLNPLKGANTTERDKALGKYLSDTVYNQLKPFFDQFENSSINPLDFIIIDGKSVSGITASPTKRNIAKDDLMQKACEVIACALLANRPVTIHVANGTLSHLNEPVRLNLDPNGFRLQSPVPAPDYFMRRFTELGFDRTNYFTSEMSADNFKYAMTSMELLKGRHQRRSYDSFTARKDFVNDWLTENNMTASNLQTMHPFSLGREASISIPRIVALGRGMSVEDVMTLGAKHDEKKAIGKELLDICNEWTEKETKLDQCDKTQVDNFNRQRSEALKQIADDTYNGFIVGVDYLSHNLIKLDIGNIEAISNPQNAQLIALQQTLHDVAQEFVHMGPYFSEMAMSKDTSAQNPFEARLNLSNKLACMKEYLTSYRNAVNSINDLLSGAPYDNTILYTCVPHILAFTIQSEMVKSAKAQRPNANFNELFDDPLALFPIYSHVTSCEEAKKLSSHKKLPEISRLIAELAVDGKLKDYVTYDAKNQKVSFDLQSLEKIVNEREASQNQVIENNRGSRKPELNESVAEIPPSNPQPKNGSIVLGA